MIANTPSAWSDRAEITDAATAVRWSRDGQAERFLSVIAALEPRAGETLLDFGCGTGALTDALPAGVQYTGYDWAGGMIDRARHDHPDRRFARGIPVAEFDLIACVGPFNLAHNWSKQQTWAVIESLWRQTRRQLAVCLYAGDDTECLVYTEDETLHSLRHLRDVGARTVVRHRPNDLLLILDRQRPSKQLPPRPLGDREGPVS